MENVLVRHGEWTGRHFCSLGTLWLSGKLVEVGCFDSLNPGLSPLHPTGYLPNSAHAVEAMLAAASIGAIWSSTSPDFGVNVSWGPVGGVPLGQRVSLLGWDSPLPWSLQLSEPSCHCLSGQL